MNKYIFIFLILVLQVNCLRAKKSPFDLSGPKGLSFGLLLFLNLNFISGSISGFTEGDLVILNNEANDYTIKGPATSYSMSAAKGSYSLSVKSHPVGLVCTIENSSGNLVLTITNANIVCVTATAKPVYANNSNWNDYVKNDGSDRFTATNTACTGSETGGYGSCIHGGEFKKIDLPGIKSCNEITASDSLGVFNWVCRVNSDSTVSLYSSSLSKEKYLSDLIDFTEVSWRKNFVTVKKGSVTFLVTTSEAWWTNEIVKDNTSFTKAGRIHIFTTDPGAISVSSIHKLGIVIKPNLFVTNGSGCSGVQFYSEGSYFQWYEGMFEPRNFFWGINLNASRFSVLKNIRIQNTATGCSGSGFSGLYVTGTQNSFFEDIRIGNLPTSGSNGLHLNTSSNNLFKSVIVSNVTNQGILLATSPNNTFINTISMNSAGAGLQITNSSNSVFKNATFVNSNNEGIVVSSGNALFSNLTAINNNPLSNSFGGINFNSVTNVTAENIVSTANSSFNNIILNSGSSIYFTGILKTSTCSSITSTGLTGSCGIGGTSDFNNSSAAINVTYTSGLTFLEKITADDSTNSSDSSGQQSYSSISDWVRFDKFYRGWGVDGGSFPSSSNRGASSSGTLRIYDWSLKSSDTILRNVNSCPDNTGYSTNAISHTFTTGSVTFIRNAVELIGDGIGDEDGLCESNESCLFTPNIGAYQGHGSIILASQSSGNNKTCNDITSGSVSNVKLYKYETNGY